MFLQNLKVRGIIYQIILLIGVVIFFMWARQNLVDNLNARNIATGYDFLDREASFDVSETLIEYDASYTYGRAFLVGILNTLQVAILGSILAVLLGVIVGIFLLSNNWLLRNVSYFYVNAIRNTPLILQLFFWYMLITEFLPLPQNSSSYLSVYITNRGFFFPVIKSDPTHLWMLAGFLIGIVGAIIFHKYSLKYQARTGKTLPSIWIGFFVILIATFLPWVMGGMPFDLQTPFKGDFDIYFGKGVSPEFMAILFGLVIYTASFIAEVVRSGIVSIPKGQTEAGLSVGLSTSYLLRFILLPQAMRVIIPPLTNQILNLFKNSTLAVAIGYPDFVSIANTTLNQTGQAIESITALMVFYLVGSLLVSAFMNWFNHKMRIIER